jgi:hypothetical protein
MEGFFMLSGRFPWARHRNSDFKIIQVSGHYRGQKPKYPANPS